MGINMGKILTAIVIITAIILTVLSAFVFPRDIITWSTGSSYYYNDDAVITVNGRTYHCNMNENGGGSFMTESGNTLCVTLTVPDLTELNYPALVMSTNHGSLDIILDGDVMLTQDSGYITFQRSYPIIINIPKNRSGSELNIIYHNNSDKSEKITASPVIFGDRQLLEQEYIADDFPIYYLSCAVCFFSVILFSFSLFFRKNEGRGILMSISIFTCISSLWLMFRTDFIFTIVRSPELVREITLFFFTLMPAAMSFLIRENMITDRKRFHIAEITALLFLIVYALLTIVLTVTESDKIYTFRNDWITFTVIIFALLLTVYTFRAGDRSIKYRYGSLASILAFTLSVTVIIIRGRIGLHAHPLLFIIPLCSLAIMIQQSVMICIGSITKKETREEMMKRLYTDPLTGMLNRRAFEDRADVIFPGNEGMYVISADIDSMKQFNDSLGHSAGDELLTAFSNAVSSALSSHDGMCFRMGGDEFLILIRNGSDVDADEIMKKAYSDFSSSITTGEASFSYGSVFWESGSPSTLRDAVRKSDETLILSKAEHYRRFRYSSGESSTLPKTSL